MQDERLKDPLATDYFDELLARIRDIRASEKRFYQKVRDIFATTSEADIVIAKNYLSEDEVTELNRLTTMFLDFAEDRARKRQQISMAEWMTRADAFLSFNERGILTNAR